MTERLKPCPFCGGEVIAETIRESWNADHIECVDVPWNSAEDDGEFIQFHCYQCDMVTLFDAYKAKERIELWNRRVERSEE